MTVRDFLFKYDNHNNLLQLNDDNLVPICKPFQIFRIGVYGEEDWLSKFGQPFLDLEIVSWGVFNDGQEITIRLPIYVNSIDYQYLPKEYKIESN